MEYSSDRFNPTFTGQAAIIDEGCKKELCLRVQGTGPLLSLTWIDGVEIGTLCACDWAKCTNGMTMGFWFRHWINAAWQDLIYIGNRVSLIADSFYIDRYNWV